MAAATLVVAACGDVADRASTTIPFSTTTSTTLTAPPSSTKGADITELSAYFIGNSLTNDTLGPIEKEVRSLAVLARQADHFVRPFGWHIKCASSLLSIFNDPDNVCVEPVAGLGVYGEALPIEEWDYLVVQPYPGSGSTLATDISVITSFADAVHEDTVILVFTGWPRHPNFSRDWDTNEIITDDSPTAHSRQYFVTLIARLDDAIDQEVRLIPSGEVLYRMQAELASDVIPGLSHISDLYQDEIHLNSLGQWLSGVTAATVMTGSDPSEFGKPSEPWYGDNIGFSREYILIVRQVVADVLAG